jgi:hypothetical protein
MNQKKFNKKVEKLYKKSFIKNMNYNHDEVICVWVAFYFSFYKNNTNVARRIKKIESDILLIDSILSTAFTDSYWWLNEWQLIDLDEEYNPFWLPIRINEWWDDEDIFCDWLNDILFDFTKYIDDTLWAISWYSLNYYIDKEYNQSNY